MREELKRLVEQARPDLSSYMRFPVRGVVTAVDAAAYTVGVQPDDPALALLPRCEVLAVWATSAARLVVLPFVGDGVMVAFEGGHPDKPFVAGFLTGAGSGAQHLVLEQGQSRVVIGADGLVTIESAVKVHVKAPAVELGAAAAEQLLKGNTFLGLFNSHFHIGNKGRPTSNPMVPLPPSVLSNTSRTE
ncbi:MAG: phage baseplate assembly protein V [bacterium]|nr:phage baseplate assembly protein V [bacterium]